MATINPNKRGMVRRAEKKLKRQLQQLKNAGSLTAGQRNTLFANVLITLVRIQLHQLGRTEDVE